MQIPTVCLVYLHADEPQFLVRSRIIMKTHPWVTKIVTLNTRERNPIAEGVDDEQRSYSFSGKFGYGFDKQPEDGGFDEIRARNHALDLAEKMGCTWTLICDCDEFFTDETYSDICDAHHQGKAVVWFSCYHFRDPSKYLWCPDYLKTVLHSKEMHDPHPRAFRTAARLRYVLNPADAYRSKLRNRTQHCQLQSTAGRKAHFVYGLRHVHTKHMFDPKRPSQEELNKETWWTATGFQMPDVMVQAWDKQEIQ